ncbi:(2Fe-2S)-binding protein [Vibrio sp. EA2]|uniref:(2Fe-2S)-binding protein n=1 Tax=Vibrio sp. EA2 TaxID=3079860 RepID=UPI00294A10D9|nr:(2Fe-2S)-binding protein [Vibrio sp. EA2]MDV6250535.1 (2Fe-2S)-binding protein [Vibrio sp. EA2]
MSDLRISKVLGPQVLIKVNGESVTVYQGESVHAALIAAEKRQLRSSLKLGEKRGVFCGMGVCYECLVTVNNVPNVRACMTEVVADMDIVIDEK